MDPNISKPDHALGFGLMGARVTPVAGTQDTSGWEAFVLDLAPGARSPLHTLSSDKVFVVTAGVVQLTVSDRVEEVAAGGFARIPAGTPHGYANVSDAPAAMVGIVDGPQLEFLRGMSALTAAGPPDPTAMAEHTAAHGVHILAPARPV